MSEKLRQFLTTSASQIIQAIVIDIAASHLPEIAMKLHAFIHSPEASQF
ncbi:hypothetical protein C4K13_2613 [Pseudomonas chlororaphis subsp. aureofaciens]|nr:hypothetical protein C4K13_2613 [Pseudomonas chlororaphis subsp. aureofaciens]